jgi:Tol biopolymer transport system component/serine/threonine protein kinase
MGESDSERWHSVEKLYYAALEQPAEQRADFLRRACPDEQLRQEVESLLGFGNSSETLKHSPLSLFARLQPVVTPGQLVGPYRCEERIGQGGMGEVYRARDTRLNRDVALKILPAAMTGDAVLRARFIREAQSASQLNHPNVVTIYDIGEWDGRVYIAMEYVTGKTLGAMIPPGGLALPTTLKYALPIADALAKAHQAGIVHRDLKPGNVMVTTEGVVKVLDFGLAKRMEAPQADGEATKSMLPETQSGLVMGTPSFMSPEQAEGKPVDARSDIFSFGSVLYEMVTGERAFHGDSMMATIAAVLREEPKPLAGRAPADFEKVILRCLRKDPGRRFQSIADVHVALLELQEESESGRLLKAAPVAPRNRTRRWLVVGAGAALIVALLVAGRLLVDRREGPAAQPTVERVTSYPGTESHPRFSPDGKQIAFSWDGEKGSNPGIYVKLLGESNALRLTSGGDDYPAWSPDGKRIAFERQEPHEGIYTVSALGGPERKVADIRLGFYSGMSWSADGKWILVSRGDRGSSQIVLVPVEGGEVRRLTNPTPPALDRCPDFAPDGHRFAYAGCTGLYSCDVYVQELTPDYTPRGSPRQVTHQAFTITGLTWSRDGASLVYSASYVTSTRAYLWRTGLDGRQPPQRLEIAGPNAKAPSFSPADNRLVFERYLTDWDVWRYRVNGGVEPLISSTLLDLTPEYSPDGTRIVFSSSRMGDAAEVWVAQADGSSPVQLTNRLGRHQGTPRWSPDGRWIAFDSMGSDGHWDIYVIEATGGAARRITTDPSDEAMPFWSRDGKWIYFRSDRKDSFQIWRIPFGGGPEERVTKNGGYTAFESVDGKELFYTKAMSGPLYGRAVAGGEERQVLPYIYNKCFQPVADGIYYIGAKNKEGYYPLEFYHLASGESRLLTKLEAPVYQGLSVAPDRKSILFVKSVNSGSDLMVLEDYP